MAAPTSPLVGRAHEVAELVAALGLGDGDPREAVLLGGDAGIGKTRLTLEVAQRARRAGFAVLVGHCLDLGDSAPSFQPFVEAFSALGDDDRASLEATVPAIAALLDPGSAAVDRGEVLGAVARALEILAEHRPVLLVVEDAHWADASTRQLLQVLLARSFGRQVALLVSYRSDDLHRRHPLRSALAEWTRLTGVRRLELGPLADTAVVELVRGRDERPISDQGLDAIIRRAGGNAFFAEELLDAGIADGALPEELADLLLVRFDRLGAEAKAVVSAASCAGGPASDAALLRATALNSAALDAALREAVDRRVLVASSEGFGFRHALLAEAVHDDLLPTERRRLHGEFLDALLEQQRVGSSAEISLHAHAAGRLEVAFEADVRAAADSTRVGGHHEAASHLTRAIEIAPPGHDVVALVDDAALALVNAGRLRTARSLLDEWLQRDLAPFDRARLLMSVAETAYFSAPEGEADDAASAGLEAVLALPDAPPALTARAWITKAASASGLRHDDEALEAAERGLALATDIGDETLAIEAQTIVNKIVARTDIDLDKPRARYSELVETSRQRGDVYGELRGLHHLAFLHLNAGELAEAEQAFREGMRRAAETGRDWAPYGFDGRFFTALVCYETGRWDEVLDLQIDDPSAPHLADASMRSIATLVAAARGETPRSDDVAFVRARWSQDVALAIHSGTALIDLAPDLASAQRAHDDLVEVLDSVWRESWGASRLRMTSLLTARASAAIGTIAAGERAAWVQQADDLLAVCEQVAADFPRLGPEGQAWLVRVRAEVARLHWVAGVEPPARNDLLGLWRDTVDAFDALGQPYELARSQARLAQVLQAGGDDVTQLVESARAAAERLGARPLAAELAAFGRRRPAGDGAQLTRRESEVLTLVSEGRSNGEIARQLFISTKTASVHVSNILAKLGAASRTEAAAIARRDGLLDVS